MSPRLPGFACVPWKQIPQEVASQTGRFILQTDRAIAMRCGFENVRADARRRIRSFDSSHVCRTFVWMPSSARRFLKVEARFALQNSEQAAPPCLRTRTRGFGAIGERVGKIQRATGEANCTHRRFRKAVLRDSHCKYLQPVRLQLALPHALHTPLFVWRTTPASACVQDYRGSSWSSTRGVLVVLRGKSG